MRIHSLTVRNDRRLKNVRIELDAKTSVFVGANNSGKTSATQILKAFLDSTRDRFSIHDFSADCWALFDEIGASAEPLEKALPTIGLDLWCNRPANLSIRGDPTVVSSAAIRKNPA
jgi:predicted ATP-dependent endonuclease of OLD family